MDLERPLVDLERSLLEERSVDLEHLLDLDLECLLVLDLPLLSSRSPEPDLSRLVLDGTLEGDEGVLSWIS